MGTPDNLVKKIVDSEDDVVNELCSLIELVAEESIAKNDKFYIGMSGGSMAKFICSGLPLISTSWGKWKLFFCDERLVPFSDSESTFKIYKEGLIQKTPLTMDQFITIDPDLNVSDAAEDYEKKLRSIFTGPDVPIFDLLLLGMGPDGHTASLFPGHALLGENSAWIAAIADSPKPPVCRITMTLPLINAAENCVFAIVGKGKADIVKRILQNHEALPAQLVSPKHGIVIWILDKEAASLLD